MRRGLVLLAISSALLIGLALVASGQEVAGSAATAPQAPAFKNLTPEEAGKRVTHTVLPEYPEAARKAHVTGTVEIGLAISPRGVVGGGSRVLTGPPPLALAASQAIHQWTFQPDMEQGKPTWSRIRALVRFNADGTTEVALAPAILPDSFGDLGSPRNAALEANTPPIIHGAPPEGPPFRAGMGGVGYPSCLSCPDATYSEEARKAKFSGVVVLQVVIQPDGHVTDIQVVKAAGLGLDERAVEAVKMWTFKPALGTEGKPVPVRTPIEVNFRIQ